MRKALNMILTALSAAILMVWIWKFFGAAPRSAA